MESRSNLIVGQDLGSSSTKGYNLTTGEEFEYDNCITPISPTADTKHFIMDSAGIDDIIKNLDVTIVKVDGDFSLPIEGRYLCGIMARQYSAHVVKPNSLLGKSEQLTTYVNALVSIGIEMIKNKLNHSQPVVGFLLPPVEAFGEGGEIFLKNICGTYDLTFNVQNKKVTIEIVEGKAHVQPEGFASFASFLFDKDGNYRSEAEPYLTVSVLGVDIGASSTDLSLIENTRPIKRTFETIRMGGNKIAGLLTAEISKNYRGYKPNADEIERAIETGILRFGTKEVSVAKELEAAKKEFAEILYEPFISYLDRQNIHPNSLSGIMFVGGGSIGDDAVRSAGYYLYEKLKQVCPYIDLISIENPRKSNLEGLIQYLRCA